MIKAIIFDCFGVIISDTLEVMRRRLAQTNPTGAAEVETLINAVNLGIISGEDCSQQIADIFEITLEEFRIQTSRGEARDPELMAYILELRQGYKTGLLSNISVGSLAKRFSDDELEQYFDAVVASGEVGVGKPDPLIYEIAAERLGLDASECLFTDDRLSNVTAAERVGMTGLLYRDLASFKTDLAPFLNQN